MSDPIDSIQWLETKSLKANNYNPNVCMTQEMRLLELSILQNGWIQPILVTKSGTIIDGFHRWSLSRSSERLNKKYAGKVPCAVLDITEAEAMMLTVRINRAKGSHVAVKMSELVRILIDEFHLTKEQVALEIGAHSGEIDLLYSEGVFKARDIPNHKYSQAWEPRKK